MPKVSVIVPVYNVQDYIRKCMESLVNQTLDDIELIIVNDGSTDGSIEIAKEYQEKNKKIKIVNKKNGGLSDARNYGVRYANGEYIAFLDSDDYVEYDTYERMYEKAIEEQADCVECNFIWEYENKSKIDIGYMYSNKSEMIIYSRVVAWNKLIKNSLLKNIDEIFPIGLRYEDIEFFYKLIPKIEKVAFIKEPKIHYVQRKTSIANTQSIKNRDIFIVLSNVLNYYKSNGLYDKYKSELEYTFSRLLLCSSFFRIVKIKDENIRKKLINENWMILNEKFPNWKKNRIIKNRKSIKNLYLSSINRYTYKIYYWIFKYIK
ncbi:MAG TPA: glycosyltransferase [Clostridia bacterium]|nr:glycosyltransferase [Clostridia bacterium]